MIERFEDYQGIVWCPTVENRTWLARRNGTVYFTGNCWEKSWEYIDWKPKATEERPKPRMRAVVKWKDFLPLHPAKINAWELDGTVISKIKFGLRNKEIPGEKIVWFTFDKEADDPTGMSVLRSAYPPWYWRQGLYRVDAAQKERHGMGIPRAKLLPSHTPKDKQLAIELVRNLRANESAGVVEPPGFEVDFIEVKGQQVNVLDSIKHHGQQIFVNVLTQFLELGSHGSGQSGSRAVGNTQMDAFSMATMYLVQYVASVFNQYAIPELIDYNYPEIDGYPTLSARVLGDEIRLRTYANALAQLVPIGAITATPELEAWLSQVMHLPSPAPEAMEREAKDRIPMPSQIKEITGNPSGGPPTNQPPGGNSG